MHVPGPHFFKDLLFLIYFISFVYLFIFKIFIGVELIYNVVLASGVQQSDSVIPIHIFILFQIL